jgi:uncharacterized protein (DUF1778 family)
VSAFLIGTTTHLSDHMCRHSIYICVQLPGRRSRLQRDNIMVREAHHSTRDQAINIRASTKQRDLIDQAAHLLGKSRSDFMLETACREAEDVLLDRTFFRLDPEAFARFNAMLDNPPAPSDELRTLLKRKAPWE